MRKLIFLLITISTGCAITGTRITSIADPSYKEYKINNLMVYCQTTDLYYKILFEDKVSSQFDEYKIEAYTGYKLLPPTREFTDADIKSYCTKHFINAIILIKIIDIGYNTQQTVIDRPYQTNTTISKAGSNNYIAHTQSSGGTIIIDEVKPYLKIQTEIIDPATGNKAWISQSITTGGKWKTIEDVIIEYTSAIVDDITYIFNIPVKDDEISQMIGYLYKSKDKTEQTDTATIDDIPKDIRYRALRMMEKKDLEKIIEGMPKSFAQGLEYETILKLYKYNKRKNSK